MRYQEEQYEEIVEDIQPLIKKHWKEIAIHQDKIKLNPDYSKYETLSAMGMIRFFTVRDKEKLVGYFVVFVQPHIHYSEHVFAMNDIIYLDPDYRGGKTAFNLINFAESTLANSGVSVLMINMKVHAPFDKLLRGCGFENTEMLYSKYIGD